MLAAAVLWFYSPPLFFKLGLGKKGCVCTRKKEEEPARGDFIPSALLLNTLKLLNLLLVGK